MSKAEFIRDAKVHENDNGLEIITQNSYGYGDIIRLASYASKTQKILDMPVVLKYLVTIDNISLTKNIKQVLDHYDLDFRYVVEIGSLKNYKHQYTNLLKKEYAKQVRDVLGCPKLKTKDKPRSHPYIAAWHPYNNLQAVEHDKMPISKSDFFDALSTNNEVHYIDYRMDIDQVFSTIRNARLCIGYEGLGQQIAYHYNKRILTLSNWKDVSINTGGPESFIINNTKDLRNFVNDWNIL